MLHDESVLVNIPDCRGFCALHYACFLREDNFINMLLDRGAKYYRLHDSSEWPDQNIVDRNRYLEETEPMNLYECDRFFVPSRIPTTIIDNDGLYHKPLILKDLLFHMDKLCLNYGIKQESDFAAANENPWSAKQFSAFAKIGLNDFLETRKAKSLNPDILARLAEVKLAEEETEEQAYHASSP